MRLILAFLLGLFASVASAQTVTQSGSVTRGHVAVWQGSGIIVDGGAATNGKITNLGIFANGGLPFCITASTVAQTVFNPASSPFTQGCLSVTSGSVAQWTLTSYNGASPASFQFVLNGTPYDFPYSIGGILGPNSSVVGDGACWNNTIGTLLADCPSLPATFAGGTVFGNPTGSSAAPVATTHPVLGIPGTSTGEIGLAGSTSGTATIAAQATAGTPTILTPTASGTMAVSATSPLHLSATTGALTIDTATSGQKGVVQGDGNTLTITAGTISCTPASSTQVGCSTLGGNTGVQGSYKNLLIANDNSTPNTKINITANALIVQDGSGNTAKLSSVSVSINSATSGAGGLDTGSLAGSTVYYEWVIAQAGGASPSAVMSLSSSAPTLPMGYTMYARVGGTAITDGSKNFFRVTQKNANAQYVVTPTSNTANLPAIASGTSGSVSAPTYTAFSVSAIVPATAGKIGVILVAPGEPGAAIAAPNGSYGPYQSTTNPPVLSQTQTNVSATYASMVLESSNIYYASSGSGSGLFCLGWEDNL